MRKTLKLVKEVLLISVLMIAACTVQLRAQTYPVQVSTQIAPPFSPYLSDYSAVGAERFMVNFLLKDPTLPEYRCKLRLTIEGVGITIRTKQSFIPQPLVLPGGGIPLQVYGEELQEYFNPNNLDFAGFTRSQYAKGAKLPDGVYRFTVEVLDYNRGTVVSNKGTTVAFIILNDPPLLNMPRTDTKIRIVDPTNIPFTWTPRHTGSPNAAFTTEYIFRLVEIWPITRNPYDAFLSQQPLYEVTTNSTQIVYGPAEPALIPGRKYAWQVQAKDVEGRDLFKNQGKSEVFVFQFGDALGAPEGLYLQTANPTSLVVRWEQNVAGTDAVKYRVRYRPHNNRKHDNWYEEESQEQWRALSQLQPETEYEVQVRAEQSVQASEYGPMKVFKTALPGANDFVCKSDVSPPPAPTTNAPAMRLGINDTIHAGGYDVLVRELSENNNGVYSGAGMAIVPWFAQAKVSVTFKKINVNEQHWLTSGEIKSVWNPDSKFLLTPDKRNDPTTAPNSGGQPIGVAETETLIEITGTSIVAVTKNEDGDIEINTSDGETQKLDKGKSYSIVDETGNGYIVGKDGEITKVTAQEARDAAGRGDRNYAIALRFEKGMAVFGFDEKKYDALATNYQQLEGGQYIPWKAVTSQTDVVNAVLDGTDIDPKKVRFEVNGSTVAHSGFTNGISAVNVLGKSEGTVEELLALYTPSEGAEDQVLGKVNMVSYDKISHNLVIVPVNNAKLPGDLDDVTLSRELTKIYGQAVADWKVSIAKTPLKVTLDEYFDDGESSLLSNYTADMKKVINAFGTLQEKTYYLFLVEKPRSGTSALGYMPRSKQAGFIFSNNLTSANAISTIAHELGHGAFNLKHTFSEYSLSKGATDNLMDYNNGTALNKYQWDHVHEPQRVIGLFEDDDEGKNATVKNLEGLAEFANKDAGGKILSYTFLARSGKPITLPASLTSITFSTGDQATCTADDKFRVSPFGTVSKFKIKDDKGIEKEYAAYWSCESKRFDSYRSGDTDIYYDKLSNASFTKAIVGFPAVVGGNLSFKVGQLAITAVPATDKYTASGTYQEYNFLADKVASIPKFNEVYASFSPAYDVNVKQFILDNIKKDGFDGTDFYDNDIYVFTHATQLQQYNILEGCFRTGVPGELLKLITEYVTSPGNQYSPGGTTKEYMVFAYSHEENPEKFNAKSLVNHWKKYDFNYYPAIAKAVQNFTVPENATAQEVYDLLKPYVQSTKSDNWDCFWDKIDVDQRIKLIHLLIPENSGLDSREEIVQLLLTTVHGPDNQRQVLEKLEAENFSLFRKVWDMIDNAERLKLSFVLSDWLLKYRSPGADYADTEYRNFYTRTNYGVGGSNDNVFYFFNLDWLGQIAVPFDADFKEEDPENNIYIKLDLDVVRDGKSHYFDYTGTPYDWVVIKIVDDFPNYGLKKDQLITIPALFLLGLDNDIDYAHNMATLRILADVAAIALAPVTAGASTAIFVIEVTAATVDIAVTMNRNELDQYLGPEAGVVWDVMYGGWNLFTLGRSFFVPTTKVVGGIERVSNFSMKMQRADEIAEAVANHANTAEKIAYLKRIDELLNVLRTEKFQNVAHSMEMFSRVLEFKMKVERSLKAAETIIDITVREGNVVVNGGLSLGKIDFIANVPTLTQNIRWLPESVKNIKLVDQYNTLATIQNGITTTGRLSVVQDLANPAQYYVARNLAITAGITATGPFKNYARVAAWLNTIASVTSKAGFETTLGTWSSTSLTQLNEALGLYPNLATELTASEKLITHFWGIHSTWYYKYGLLRDHYRTAASSLTLPENFRKLAEAMPVSRSDPGRLIGTELATMTDKIQKLGWLFEEVIVPEVGTGFITGSFADFPPALSAALTDLYSQGYRVVVTQSIVSAGGKSPRPDMLLFKLLPGGAVNFRDVVVIDSKLDAAAAYEVGKDAQYFLAVLQGTTTQAPILPFNSTYSPTIFSATQGLELDMFAGQAITISQFFKIGTTVEGNVYSITLKSYKPR